MVGKARIRPLHKWLLGLIGITPISEAVLIPGSLMTMDARAQSNTASQPCPPVGITAFRRPEDFLTATIITTTKIRLMAGPPSHVIPNALRWELCIRRRRQKDGRLPNEIARR